MQKVNYYCHEKTKLNTLIKIETTFSLFILNLKYFLWGQYDVNEGQIWPVGLEFDGCDLESNFGFFIIYFHI